MGYPRGKRRGKGGRRALMGSQRQKVIPYTRDGSQEGDGRHVTTNILVNPRRTRRVQVVNETILATVTFPIGVRVNRASVLTTRFPVSNVLGGWQRKGAACVRERMGIW